jgi:hypothetical protein
MNLSILVSSIIFLNFHFILVHHINLLIIILVLNYKYTICYPKLTASYSGEYFQTEIIRIKFDTLIEYENFDKSLNYYILKNLIS